MIQMKWQPYFFPVLLHYRTSFHHSNSYLMNIVSMKAKKSKPNCRFITLTFERFCSGTCDYLYPGSKALFYPLSGKVFGPRSREFKTALAQSKKLKKGTP